MRELSINNISVDERRKICEACPIYSPIRGLCNPKLWFDPNTNEVSTTAKAGYIIL